MEVFENAFGHLRGTTESEFGFGPFDEAFDAIRFRLISSCEVGMAKFFSRLFKRAKKRIKARLKDLRTWRLYMAGREILAEQDYEHLHVAKVSAKAGISVGAFYERFKSKDDFLSFLISERFIQAQSQAKDALDPRKLYGASAPQIVRVLTHHIVSTMHGPMGGVVKAAVKRGQIDEAQQRQLAQYRAAVTEQALVLLKPKVGESRRAEQQIRAAVQMMHAVVIDILHHDGGVLRRGSKHTTDVLAAMMLGYLDLPLGHLARAKGAISGDDLIDMPVEFGPTAATVNAIEASKNELARKKPNSVIPKLQARPRPACIRTGAKARII